MLVTRNALQTYPQLAGYPNPNYFRDISARNNYYGSTSIPNGQYCAIGGDPDSNDPDDWNEAVWRVDQYNGSNWVEVAIDTNFALIVTNAGLRALTDAVHGQYKLEISRIAIRQTGLDSANVDLLNWTASDFLYGAANGYNDVCLDTANRQNTTFTLENNLSWRTNLLNGGLQFTVKLDVSTMGQEAADITPTLTDYNVSMIALFVKNQTSTANEDVLFAVANLPTSVKKLTTTPNRIGNALKFYLNTTLTNLGNATDLDIITDSVNSIAEVITEDELPEYYDGVSSPYNIFLVDSFNGTNVPALAVRKGNPVDIENPISWTFFTPTDDCLRVEDPDLISADLANYMIAAWDTVEGKYVPADGSTPLANTQHLAGLYNNNTIIYSGKIMNSNRAYTYQYRCDTSQASGYLAGETLVAEAEIVGTGEYQRININIVAVGNEGGREGVPVQYTITPVQGNTELTTHDTYVSTAYPDPEHPGSGTGLMIRVNSILNGNIAWNFPTSWIDRPLFADTGANAGLLTTTETEMFVGWCINSSTIKLALDLRNEATFSSYGTTRYATYAETANTGANPDAYETTAIVPRNLKRNYFQITLPSTSETDANINLTNDGRDRSHAIKVDTYTTFTKSIECTGTDLDGVAFKGTAYRALWEDLAEYYSSDQLYPAGTLICIGSGTAEITVAKNECNGIISTKPGFELGNKSSAFDLPVALIGKVPVLFADDCTPVFGDRIYLSKNIPGRASTIPFGKCLGKIIDKREHLDQVNNILCSIRIQF